MKETFYFSHDYNARNDEKIIKLLSKEGSSGYGIYWMIIEKLYEANGYLDQDYESISFDIRTEYERIKNVIENFNLFIIKDKKISSKSVLERLDIRKEKSKKARESVMNRWNNTNVLRTLNDSNTIKESKVKENKYIISEPSSPNIKSLYENMGIPKQVKKVNLWQDEASNAVKYFSDGEDKRSSIFKCFKDRQDKARFAFSDCKELDKHSALYFLKVYNDLIKK